MRIGVDIDDTTSKTDESLEEEAYKYDKKFLNGRGYQDRTAYKFIEKFFWNVVDVSNFFDYLRKSKFYLQLEVMENAPKCINKLRSMGHEIIFITRRGNHFKTRHYTKKWLKKNGIGYDKLIMGAEDKGKVVVEENIDILIDDDVRNIKKVMEAGKRGLLMTNKYNQDEKKIERVNDWKEIYKKIKEG